MGIITSQHRERTAARFANSLSANDVNSTWVVAASHVPIVGDAQDEAHDISMRALYIDMIFAKKTTSNSALLMTRAIPWESNTAYAAYDDGDPLLHEKNFFVQVEDGSFTHVWKCLDNASNTASVISPDVSELDPDDVQYQTIDGYRWYYMYSVDEAVIATHATATLFPVIANTVVVEASVTGTIDVIAVDDIGEGYDNYIAGSFQTDEVRYGGDPLVYKLVGGSLIDDFYTGCMLYITGGAGSGQIKRVLDSYSNSSGVFIEIEESFTTAPLGGSEYEVTPEVIVEGVYTDAVLARAIINSAASNSIYYIDVLDRGSGWQHATASVVASNSVGVERVADIRPIISPSDGHGSDPGVELGARWVALHCSFSNTESNTIPSNGAIQRLGIISNPLLADVQLVFDVAATGTFILGETVRELADSRVLASNAQTAISNTTVELHEDVSDLFRVGDYVYLESSDELRHQIAVVNSIVDANTITLDRAALFSCTEVYVALANVGATGEIASLNASAEDITLSSWVGVVGTGDIMIGDSSGARGEVDYISRGGVPKGFTTLIGATRLIANNFSGTFTLDEVVYQGANLASATARGALHSTQDTFDANSNFSMLVTNSVGTWTANTLVKGNSSGATATLAISYSPEIMHATGDVLYHEYVTRFTRELHTSQSLIFVFSF